MKANFRYAPMLLCELQPLPTGPEWTYEPKLDGWRMLGAVATGSVTFVSRANNDLTSRYPAVAADLPAALSGHGAVVDGEMIAVDAQGKMSYNALRSPKAQTIHCIFDLIELDGVPLLNKPLEERRARLDDIFVAQPHIEKIAVVDDYEALLSAAKEQGLEGVVAKRLGSFYQPGVRSRDWYKQLLIRHKSWNH